MITNTSQRIKELRTKLGLSMRSFSNELKISNNTFSNYESGKRKPSIETCYKIISYAKKHGIPIKISWLRPKE